MSQIPSQDSIEINAVEAATNTIIGDTLKRALGTIDFDRINTRNVDFKKAIPQLEQLLATLQNNLLMFHQSFELGQDPDQRCRYAALDPGKLPFDVNQVRLVDGWYKVPEPLVTSAERLVAEAEGIRSASLDIVAPTYVDCNGGIIRIGDLSGARSIINVRKSRKGNDTYVDAHEPIVLIMDVHDSRRHETGSVWVNARAGGYFHSYSKVNLYASLGGTSFVSVPSSSPKVNIYQQPGLANVVSTSDRWGIKLDGSELNFQGLDHHRHLFYELNDRHRVSVFFPIPTEVRGMVFIHRYEPKNEDSWGKLEIYRAPEPKRKGFFRRLIS